MVTVLVIMLTIMMNQSNQKTAESPSCYHLHKHKHCYLVIKYGHTLNLVQEMDVLFKGCFKG